MCRALLHAVQAHRELLGLGAVGVLGRDPQRCLPAGRRRVHDRHPAIATPLDRDLGPGVVLEGLLAHGVVQPESAQHPWLRSAALDRGVLAGVVAVPPALVDVRAVTTLAPPTLPMPPWTTQPVIFAGSTWAIAWASRNSSAGGRSVCRCLHHREHAALDEAAAVSALARDLAPGSREHPLLVGRPVEVAAGQVLADPGEGHRVVAAEVDLAGLGSRLGLRYSSEKATGLATVIAADVVDHVLEEREPGHEDVVRLDADQVADGLGRAAAGRRSRGRR